MEWQIEAGIRDLGIINVVMGSDYKAEDGAVRGSGVRKEDVRNPMIYILQEEENSTKEEERECPELQMENQQESLKKEGNIGTLIHGLWEYKLL